MHRTRRRRWRAAWAVMGQRIRPSKPPYCLAKGNKTAVMVVKRLAVPRGMRGLSENRPPASERGRCCRCSTRRKTPFSQAYACADFLGRSYVRSHYRLASKPLEERRGQASLRISKRKNLHENVARTQKIVVLASDIVSPFQSMKEIVAKPIYDQQ
jgi:hypothetical protein